MSVKTLIVCSGGRWDGEQAQLARVLFPSPLCSFRESDWHVSDVGINAEPLHLLQGSCPGFIHWRHWSESGSWGVHLPGTRASPFRWCLLETVVCCSSENRLLESNGALCYITFSFNGGFSHSCFLEPYCIE